MAEKKKTEENTTKVARPQLKKFRDSFSKLDLDHATLVASTNANLVKSMPKENQDLLLDAMSHARNQHKGLKALFLSTYIVPSCLVPTSLGLMGIGGALCTTGGGAPAGVVLIVIAIVAAVSACVAALITAKIYKMSMNSAVKKLLGANVYNDFQTNHTTGVAEVVRGNIKYVEDATAKVKIQIKKLDKVIHGRTVATNKSLKQEQCNQEKEKLTKVKNDLETKLKDLQNKLVELQKDDNKSTTKDTDIVANTKESTKITKEIEGNDKKITELDTKIKTLENDKTPELNKKERKSLVKEAKEAKKTANDLLITISNAENTFKLGNKYLASNLQQTITSLDQLTSTQDSSLNIDNTKTVREISKSLDESKKSLVNSIAAVNPATILAKNGATAASDADIKQPLKPGANTALQDTTNGQMTK